MRARIIKIRYVVICLIAAAGAYLHPEAVEAMSIAQMRTLTGNGLLGLRVDKVFHHCGLPASIADADASREKHALRWDRVPMHLSAGDWDLTYVPRQHAAPGKDGWINPHPGHSACLAGLATLVLHANGNSGILSVRKRADNHGYVTTYHVPDDRYDAHQVSAVTGRWKTGVPVSRLLKRFGKPDETLKNSAGVPLHRYWIVEKNNRQMPISLHAVDFEIGHGGKTSSRYIVRTRGVGFVQQKMDALMRQWEKGYVLD